MTKAKSSWAHKLSTAERVSRAKFRTKKLIGLILVNLQIHANNKAALHSNKLSSQIPRSHAANAFNEFARSLRYYELVRLSALWDRSAEDRISIPTIVDLVACDEVQSALQNEHLEYNWTTAVASIDRGLDARIFEHIKAAEIDFFSRLCRKAALRMKSAIALSHRLENSSRFKAIKRARDHFLAHSLDESTMTNVSKVNKVRQGDEYWLLVRSVIIADALYIGINGTAFSWDSSCRIVQKSAHSLWANCKLSVIE